MVTSVSLGRLVDLCNCNTDCKWSEMFMIIKCLEKDVAFCSYFVFSILPFIRKKNLGPGDEVGQDMNSHHFFNVNRKDADYVVSLCSKFLTLQTAN